ncbi:MAG: preprotein translocase subunit SecB [Lachnospiraceae bacterium]|nr:preprotein translocase subunit SecB [Lachnospiraceae bacterium]
MKVETKYVSPLILEDILISESKFKRAEEDLEDIKLGIKVERDIKKISDNEYRVELALLVADENERISAFVKGIGRFRTDQENQSLIERNTIAIMFPYLRSYISTLTTQPGMAPVVLPAINIVSMLQDK